jgi:hypothetical protein
MAKQPGFAICHVRFAIQDPRDGRPTPDPAAFLDFPSPPRGGMQRGHQRDHRRRSEHDGGRSAEGAGDALRSVQLLARRTSPLFREGLRDVQRNRLRVRERNVGHHGDDEAAFGKRHEIRRATDELPFAAMARHPRGLSREWKRLEIPAKTVPGLRARPIPNRTRSDGVDRNAAAPA